MESNENEGRSIEDLRELERGLAFCLMREDDFPPECGSRRSQVAAARRVGASVLCSEAAQGQFEGSGKALPEATRLAALDGFARGLKMLEKAGRLCAEDAIRARALAAGLADGAPSEAAAKALGCGSGRPPQALAALRLAFKEDALLASAGKAPRPGAGPRSL